jgi:hypothetical protein
VERQAVSAKSRSEAETNQGKVARFPRAGGEGAMTPERGDWRTIKFERSNPGRGGLSRSGFGLFVMHISQFRTDFPAGVGELKQESQTILLPAESDYD